MISLHERILTIVFCSLIIRYTGTIRKIRYDTVTSFFFVTEVFRV